MFVRLTPGSLTKWLPWVRGINVQGDTGTIYIGNGTSSQLTKSIIFQRGRYTTNQCLLSHHYPIIIHIKPYKTILKPYIWKNGINIINLQKNAESAAVGWFFAEVLFTMSSALPMVAWRIKKEVENGQLLGKSLGIFLVIPSGVIKHGEIPKLNGRRLIFGWGILW